MKKQLLCEFFGTAVLLAVIVGSGVMGRTLSQGNDAIALLANSIATGAGLYVLILIFLPISGSHFNPVVSLVEWLSNRSTFKKMISYMMAQISGAIVGVFIAHGMFGLSLLQLSRHDRGDARFYFSEFIATSGLISVILLLVKRDAQKIPAAVALYITAAYWFTSSTSFANPAVTIARSMTDSFSGISWPGVPGFILAQVCGAIFVLFLSVKLNMSSK